MLFTPLHCELGGMPTPVSILPQVTQLAAIGVRVLPVRTLAEAAQRLHARRARWLWQDWVTAGAVFGLILILSGLIYGWKVTSVDTINIFTGAGRGTYQQFIKNFATVAQQDGQDVTVVETAGSRENLKRLINSEEPAWAIVQADLLALYDSKSSELVKKLRLVFRLYNEEIHVFASKEIKAFSDLQDKRLVVGKQESGNWVTSENLLQKLHIQPREKLYLTPQEGVLAVLKGEAEAMIYVAGKPIPLFSDYFADLKEQPDYALLFDKVHFLPLDNLGLSSGYQPAEITPDDYPWIDRKVPTLSTQAIVISLDYFSFPRLCQKMFRLGQSVRNHIAELRQNGHPKWREVDLDGTVNIKNLERDVCSRESTDDIVKALAETTDSQFP
jgi:TRAP transporter TAXI family solute receptor